MNDVIVSEGAESVFMIEIDSYPAATVEWFKIYFLINPNVKYFILKNLKGSKTVPKLKRINVF